tara:strand:+ start:404 stop:775 length:372 start_codon:yes stop_codon:yes gene_type:complete
MHLVDLIGRIFLSLIFLIAGIRKIFNIEGTLDYMWNYGLADYLLAPAIIIEILFPILVIIGYKTKLSSLILSLFAILLAIIFHNDFNNQMQLMSFLKNFAIAGGFLIIFVKGPGKYSLDQKFN